jgi:hypothetical protein
MSIISQAQVLDHPCECKLISSSERLQIPSDLCEKSRGDQIYISGFLPKGHVQIHPLAPGCPLPLLSSLHFLKIQGHVPWSKAERM